MVLGVGLDTEKLAGSMILVPCVYHKTGRAELRALGYALIGYMSSIDRDNRIGIDEVYWSFIITGC